MGMFGPTESGVAERFAARHAPLYISGPSGEFNSISLNTFGADGTTSAVSGQFEVPFFISASGTVAANSGIPLVLSAAPTGYMGEQLAQRAGQPAFNYGPVYGSGLRIGLTGEPAATLFIAVPGSSYMPGVAGGPSRPIDFGGGSGFLGEDTLPLFIGDASGYQTTYTEAGIPMLSGIFALYIPGASNMYPKEKGIYRRADVNSDGFYISESIWPGGESGVTLFLEGDYFNDPPTSIYLNNAVTSLPEDTTE